jgi:iron complex outermembrane receptor protein
MAGYQFHLGASRLTVQLNIENLLDEDFFESSGDYMRSRIRPGIPRSFFGNIRMDF